MAAASSRRENSQFSNAKGGSTFIAPPPPRDDDLGMVRQCDGPGFGLYANNHPHRECRFLVGGRKWNVNCSPQIPQASERILERPPNPAKDESRSPEGQGGGDLG